MRRGAARWRLTPNLTPTLTLTLAITLTLALTLTLPLPLTLTLIPGAARVWLRAAARLATAGGQRHAPG